jgi:uncharacterized protein (DUF433 family)
MNNILKRIEINPKVLFGKPVIKGTRIPIEIILKKLSQDTSVDKILEDYPNLTLNDIKAAIAYASESLSTDEIIAIPITK